MKKLLLLLVVSLLCMALQSGTAAAEHPAQAIMQLYSGDLKNLNTIEPYIVSILALNEVENNRNFSQVKRFIQWYFGKLNHPDDQGLNGTVYVYLLSGISEQSTRKYDSADGYAGMFLHLLRQYVAKTGDVQLLKDHWAQIEEIAAIIPALQDQDGLTWAMPRYKVKYLMDNCESYGGISAYLELRNLAGLDGRLQYRAKLILLRKGIWEELYDSNHAAFFWAKVENGSKSASVWDMFYPDAFAQIFPIYYDVLADQPTVRNTLWGEFTKRYAATMDKLPIEQRILYELTKKKIERTGLL